MYAGQYLAADTSLKIHWLEGVLTSRQANLLSSALLLDPFNLQNFTKQVANSVEVWAVDTACVVPVTIINKPYAKAYAYRNSTANLRNERLNNLPYSGSAIKGATFP